MSVLGFIAALQVCAVLWHYSGAIQQQVKESAMNAQATPPPAAMEQAPPIRPVPSAADGQKVKQLLDDASLKFRLGDFEASLKILDQVETLSPNDPKVLWVKSLVLEKMDQPAEAVLQLEALLRVPGLPAADRANISKKIDHLAEAISSSNPPATGSNNYAMPGETGSEARSATGIRAGATLGIVDVRVKDGKRGMKTLSVAVKSLPGEEIVGDKVKILAYFYEKTEEGEVELTESKIISSWMSPPIDWAEDEPELLDLQYAVPSGSDTGATSSRSYVGYVVGLYYNGELQDFRSEPAHLIRDFPLPLADTQ